MGRIERKDSPVVGSIQVSISKGSMTTFRSDSELQPPFERMEAILAPLPANPCSFVHIRKSTDQPDKRGWHDADDEVTARSGLVADGTPLRLDAERRKLWPMWTWKSACLSAVCHRVAAVLYRVAPSRHLWGLGHALNGPATDRFQASHRLRTSPSSGRQQGIRNRSARALLGAAQTGEEFDQVP